MGWDYGHKAAGETVKEHISRHYSTDGVSRIVDLAVVKARTAYAAYRTEDGTVIGVVLLLDYRPKDRYNFGFKFMDEAMGPFADECPESILRQLTPLPALPAGFELPPEYNSEHEPQPDAYKYCAYRWRAACEENLRRHQATRKLTDGQTIEFAEPIKFTNGRTVGTFTVRIKVGRPYFYDDCGRRYRLGDWSKRAYTVGR